jgi:hypothetical protein
MGPCSVLAVPDEPRPGRTLLDQVETFLAAVLHDLVPDPTAARGVGRPRILPALALWGALLVGILRGYASQRALWRLLSQAGLWDFPRWPISDQAVYQRLAQAGPAPMEQLFRQVSALLAERLTPWAHTDLAPWAPCVVALDQTTLDPVARTLPLLRPLPRGAKDLLPGKLSGLLDVRTQQWRHLRYTPDPVENERVAAPALVADLPAGSLVLADLGYWSFPWFDQLTDQGLWWVSRLKARGTYTERHVLYQDAHGTRDALVWLGGYRADHAKHTVRLVAFRHRGTTYQYLTNVLDPRQLAVWDIARLYARRWDIELAFKLAKRELGLHRLWSAKVSVLLQQVWAVLLLSQIVQALRWEIAGRAGVDPFDVSLPLLVQFLPQLARRGEDPLQVFLARGWEAGWLRPSRRTRIQAPAIDLAALSLPPPDLVLVRPPRYAHRISTPRKYPHCSLPAN